MPSRSSVPAAAEEVLARLLDRQSVEVTRRTYRAHNSKFLAWCYQKGIDPLVGTSEPARNYIAELERRGLAPRTLTAVATAVRQFYAQAVRDGLLDGSPLAGVRLAALPKALQYASVDHLDREDLRALLEHAADADRTDDAVIVGLMGLCGLKPGEVSAARLDDVRTSGGRVLLHVSQSRRREFSVELPPYVTDAIKRHVADRTTGPLVLNEYGNRLNRENIDRSVARVARRAGVRVVRPTELRASMVALCLQAGVSPPALHAVIGTQDMRAMHRILPAEVDERPTLRLHSWLLSSDEQNLMEEARRLRALGAPPAFVIVCAASVVEATMRAVCESLAAAGLIDAVPEEPKLDWYKGHLRSWGMIRPSEASLLHGKFALRHSAAHGRGLKTLTLAQADEVLTWADDLVRNLQMRQPARQVAKRRRP